MWPEHSNKLIQDNYKPDRYQLAKPTKETYRQKCKKEKITSPLLSY
jgi:hypothetical protein